MNREKLTTAIKTIAERDGCGYDADTVKAKMEEDLVDIFSQLSEEDFVVAVEQLKVQHSSATMTNHAEVAATATANVITFF